MLSRHAKGAERRPLSTLQVGEEHLTATEHRHQPLARVCRTNTGPKRYVGQRHDDGRAPGRPLLRIHLFIVALRPLLARMGDQPGAAGHELERDLILSATALEWKSQRSPPVASIVARLQASSGEMPAYRMSSTRQ